MLVLSPSYFAGDIDFGTITQANMLFQILWGCITALSGQIGVIADLGAQALRVQQLRDALDDIEEMAEFGALEDESDEEAGLTQEGPIEMVELPPGGALRLRLEHVELCPPGSITSLLRGLNLSLNEGESLLLRGESGIGKSSLLRGVVGLWTSGRGTIQCIEPSKVFLLPQEPYMCLGTLRENLLYPSPPDEEKRPDDEIHAALRDANMPYLSSRFGLDDVIDFDAVLSGGEKQRLSFARLLLRRGMRLAILDEATSALDEANEASLYALLKDRVGCFVSVGHRPQLANFHSRTLTLVKQTGGPAIGQLS